MGITRTVAAEWRRRRACDPHRYVGCEFDCPGNSRIDGEGEHLHRLRAAILALPERERLAVYVFYLQNRSAEDARTILNLSRAGLYRLLGRARKRLERLMEMQTENA